MDCNIYCQEELNKIHQNNKKMNEIEIKGQNRTYTETERNEYNELYEESEKLQSDHQMCMDGCEERKRRHQDATEKTTGEVVVHYPVKFEVI